VLCVCATSTVLFLGGKELCLPSDGGEGKEEVWIELWGRK